MKIGIIGGYGKFGTQLAEKLEVCGFEVLRSPDKSKNNELARASHILFLAVPPSQVEVVLSEIRGDISQTEVISCAAFVKLETISQFTRGHCIRIISDPHFHLLASLGDSEKSNDVLAYLSNKYARLKDDAEMDRFTKLIAIFFVTLALHGFGSTLFLEARQHLSYYCPQEYLQTIPTPELGLYLTKAGISEFIMTQVRVNPEITFNELLRAIDERF